MTRSDIKDAKKFHLLVSLFLIYSSISPHERRFPWLSPRDRSSLNTSYLSGLVRFLKDEDGPTAVEYAVMLALIIVVCVAAITTLGSNANNTFSNVALNAAVSSSS